MPKMMFTKLAVDKLDTPTKEQGQAQHFENLEKGRALVLSISYGGTKTWRVLYYVGGKPRSKRLGVYPKMSVADARKAARDFDAGYAVASNEAGTFKKIAEDWIVEYVDEKGLRTKSEIVRHLTTYVYPVWETRPIFEIGRLDVNLLLRDIAKRGKSQADAVLQTIRSVMTWYAVQNDKYNSPIVKGMTRDKRKKADRARPRTLSEDEIRLVWNACDELDNYGELVRMLLLTGQRLRKVAGMKWSHVADGKWTIHTEKNEKPNATMLVLPTQALNIINRQQRIGGNPYIFPARSGRGPITAFSHRKREIDRLLPKDMEPWVLHDLRRTARTLMAKIGIAQNIAERTLGHAMPIIVSIYDRHDYTEEKAEALRRLANKIETIINPPAGTNVIPMRAEKS